MSDATQAQNTYSGEALYTFVLGLADSKSVVDKILADAGIDKIDPEAWYDFTWAEDFLSRPSGCSGRPCSTSAARP